MLFLHQGSDKLCAHHCGEEEQQGGLKFISVHLILGHKRTMAFPEDVSCCVCITWIFPSLKLKICIGKLCLNMAEWSPVSQVRFLRKDVASPDYFF